MFSFYDKTNFPDVKVTLMGNIETDDDFHKFALGWLELYDHNEPFTLTFDTKLMKTPKMKYSFYMASFIKQLKTRTESNYLKNSKIYVYNKWIYYLLRIIFKIQKPVAPVNIIYNHNNTIDNYWVYP